jgi:hypothetical protein
MGSKTDAANVLATGHLRKGPASEKRDRALSFLSRRFKTPNEFKSSFFFVLWGRRPAQPQETVEKPVETTNRTPRESRLKRLKGRKSLSFFSLYLSSSSLKLRESTGSTGSLPSVGWCFGNRLSTGSQPAFFIK